MDMVKVDIQKLQLLNERIGQTLEALEQVRASVQGLQHSSVPPSWQPQPFVQPPPFSYPQQQNPFYQAFTPYVPFHAWAFHQDPRQQYQPQYDPRQYSPQQYSPQQYSPQPYQPQYQPQYNQPSHPASDGTRTRPCRNGKKGCMATTRTAITSKVS